MSLMDLFPALFDGFYIKLIFLIHFTVLGVIALSSYVGGVGYIVYNAITLFVLALAIADSANAEVCLLATASQAVSVILDFLNLIVNGGSLGSFIIIMILLNAMLKIPTSLLLLKNYTVRAGVEDPTQGVFGPTVVNDVYAPPNHARTSYQDIESRGT